MTTAVHIDVLFDFICPWCLIGKRQLQRALQMLAEEAPQAEVTVSWHGVQLLPNLPPKGEPFEAFYLQRLGSHDAVRMRQAQVRDAAAAVGLEIDFGRIPRMPNTADAHRLFAEAGRIGSREQIDALLERLFAGYFQRGEDLGHGQTLLDIAGACGFDSDLLADSLSESGRPYVGSRRAGNGVPAFRFNAQLEQVGAQPAEVLLQSLRDVLRSRQPA